MKAKLRKRSERSFHRLVLVTAIACALGDMAMAQTTAVEKNSPAAAKNTASGEMVLEEVIVTAEKRAESLQKTPIAMSAFGAGDLEKMQVSNIMNLDKVVPSLVLYESAGNKAAPAMYIRGIGQTDIQTTKDSAIGVYLDGVSLGRANGLAADMADLERVEVLRGPQGTLYGRNTTGGAINFITRKPEKDFSFEQQLDSGSYGLLSLRTRVNAPLSENLYTRFTYMRSSDDGWVKNTNSTLPNQINFNKENKEALKWAFRLQATQNLTVDYSLDSSKLTYGNFFWQPVATAGRVEQTASPKGLSPSVASVGGHNLTLSWDLGGAVLKSITAYRKLDSEVNPNYVEVFIQNNKVTQDQTSQEFQLIGDVLDKRVKYIAGLYYYKENSDELGLSIYNPTLRDQWTVKATSKSSALYGQATWKPAVLDDRLGLTLGLRDTSDTRDAIKTFVTSGFYPVSNGVVVPGHKTFSKMTPTLTADYALSNDVNAYAKASTGYRAGGFNVRSTLAGFGNGFNMETLRAYEVGLKADMLDRRLRVNVAAFQNKYSDMQIDQVRTPSVFTDTLNAGKATVKGLELEMKAMLTKGLTANLFYSYLDGKYDTFLDNGVDMTAVKAMPFVPKSQGGAGVEYSPNILADYGKLTFNLDYKWTADFYSGPSSLLPNTNLTAGYHVWDARVQLANIRAAKGTVRVAAWAKNLTDEKYRVAMTNLGVYSTRYGEPRTLGLSLIYEYY